MVQCYSRVNLVQALQGQVLMSHTHLIFVILLYRLQRTESNTPYFVYANIHVHCHFSTILQRVVPINGLLFHCSILAVCQVIL